MLCAGATKRHYDLGLHCYGETISWAIPRELSKPAEQTERLAIETLRHRIRYTLYEGATVRSAEKPTGVWDIGYYTVRSAARHIAPRARHGERG